MTTRPVKQVWPLHNLFFLFSHWIKSITPPSRLFGGRQNQSKLFLHMKCGSYEFMRFENEFHCSSNRGYSFFKGIFLHKYINCSNYFLLFWICITRVNPYEHYFLKLTFLSLQIYAKYPKKSSFGIKFSSKRNTLFKTHFFCNGAWLRKPFD